MGQATYRSPQIASRRVSAGLGDGPHGCGRARRGGVGGRDGEPGGEAVCGDRDWGPKSTNEVQSPAPRPLRAEASGRGSVCHVSPGFTGVGSVSARTPTRHFHCPAQFAFEM